MNTFGDKFRVSIFGESHGTALGVVLDGVRAGVSLCVEDFRADIERRRTGSEGTSRRREEDKPEILSGIFNGLTTGAPLAIIFRNNDIRSTDYEKIKDHPRPSHADWAARLKFGGHNDYRGGGHFSGRLTLPLVCAGVVARKMLGNGIKISSRIIEIGGQTDQERIWEALRAAISEGDSLGGVIECKVEGLPAGLGEPFFDSVESLLAHILFSIPAVKGVEFGAGFGAARLKGSQNNDPIVDALGATSTNNSGGITGGLTNSNPLVVRVAVKPTPSISKPQMTFSTSTGKVEELRIGGRHDACIALRVPVIVESAVAIGLVQLI